MCFIFLPMKKAKIRHQNFMMSNVDTQFSEFFRSLFATQAHTRKERLNPTLKPQKIERTVPLGTNNTLLLCRSSVGTQNFE
mmetsp:Transcript_8192/g.11900  ORF Transcript_8192/g.11900 Transcript_8192/m.11900 type:complete len:81 (-) Transcript_8192:1185-1427(-)